MTIPEVRLEMIELAKELMKDGKRSAARRIRYLESNLYRRRRLKRTARKSQKFTRRLAKQIRDYKYAYPHRSLQEIGVLFHVNSARVSEALIGRRT